MSGGEWRMYRHSPPATESIKYTLPRRTHCLTLYQLRGKISHAHSEQVCAFVYTDERQEVTLLQE